MANLPSYNRRGDRVRFLRLIFQEVNGSIQEDRQYELSCVQQQKPAKRISVARITKDKTKPLELTSARITPVRAAGGRLVFHPNLQTVVELKMAKIGNAPKDCNLVIAVREYDPATAALRGNYENYIPLHSLYTQSQGSAVSRDVSVGGFIVSVQAEHSSPNAPNAAPPVYVGPGGVPQQSPYVGPYPPVAGAAAHTQVPPTHHQAPGYSPIPGSEYSNVPPPVPAYHNPPYETAAIYQNPYPVAYPPAAGSAGHVQMAPVHQQHQQYEPQHHATLPPPQEHYHEDTINQVMNVANVSKVQAIQALAQSGGSADAAVIWLFEHGGAGAASGARELPSEGPPPHAPSAHAGPSAADTLSAKYGHAIPMDEVHAALANTDGDVQQAEKLLFLQGHKEAPVDVHHHHDSNAPPSAPPAPGGEVPHEGAASSAAGAAEEHGKCAP